MPLETWVYDGSMSPGGWKELTEIWVCDGDNTWRSLIELWVCKGDNSWEQVFEVGIHPGLLDSVTIGISGDTEAACATGKCDRCVDWITSNADSVIQHIRILRATGGGSFVEIVDDLGLESTCGTCSEAGCSSGTAFDDAGCYCGHFCGTHEVSTEFRVRLEEDGTDTLVGLSVERTTNSLSDCTGVG